MGGSREPLGLPGPGQQPLELVGLGPARDHTLEHVGEPRQGLDPVELRGRHQARHDRPVADTAVRDMSIMLSSLMARARGLRGSVRSRATALADEGWLLPRTVAVLGILE